MMARGERRDDLQQVDEHPVGVEIREREQA